MTAQVRLSAALVEPAYGLSALRIAVVAVLLVTPELYQAPQLARTPGLLVSSPEGLAFLQHVRFSPELVGALRVLAYSAGATALLGYFARTSCAVLCATATFLISFSQRLGATYHDMHLLWLLALLAASPCADVWSLDAWGRRRPSPSLRYGLALCLARGLLGLVYFFPGLHKLESAGLEWGSAHNLQAIMYGKWFQEGRLPFLRVDAWPWLLALGGAAVILFELSFVVLALLPRTRHVALGLGVSFHLATRLFLFIDFPSLWLCYVVLLPWQRLWQRVDGGKPQPRAHPSWPPASLTVGGVLLLLAAVQGARGQTQAYPFACYPTFAGLSRPVAPDLVVELVQRDGSSVRLERDFARYRSQQQWRQIYWLLGAYGGTASDEQLRRFARAAASERGLAGKFDSAVRLRLLSADYSTRPEDWSKPPLREHTLRELVEPRP